VNPMTPQEGKKSPLVLRKKNIVFQESGPLKGKNASLGKGEWSQGKGGGREANYIVLTTKLYQPKRRGKGGENGIVMQEVRRGGQRERRKKKKKGQNARVDGGERPPFGGGEATIPRKKQTCKPGKS